MLQSYADASGTSLARACSEILAETAPVMVELANAIREAKTAPAKAMRNVNNVMQEKLAQIDQMRMDLTPKETKKTG